MKRNIWKNVDDIFMDEDELNEPVHDGIAATWFNMRNDGTDQPFLDNDPDPNRRARKALRRQN